MLYSIIIFLEIFCLYHAIRSRASYWWLIFIFFVPVVGCAVYLLTQVFSNTDVSKAQQEVTNIVNPGKRVRDLEKQVSFVDTFENKVKLADAYLAGQQYDKAIETYHSALEGHYQEDFYVICHLIKAYFKKDDYAKVLEYANKIKDKKDFQQTEFQFLYGVALEKHYDLMQAEEIFKKIDVRYSNYPERLYFAKFLKAQNRNQEAIAILEEIVLEGENMNRNNYRTYKYVVQEANNLLEELY
ncbi:hypothetical protein ACG2LH_14105 [Zhouia sp. PK063]|uniref:hypothetical protein n=1 Tax=Zhouia sp. PK063 TaxID=3373602 RepID=UPI0037A9A6EC